MVWQPARVPPLEVLTCASSRSFCLKRQYKLLQSVVQPVPWKMRLEMLTTMIAFITFESSLVPLFEGL